MFTLACLDLHHTVYHEIANLLLLEIFIWLHEVFRECSVIF
uniref:Uncharacterized protein n=1 Tax=Rhizophora mucronata TaxID=61149 RepID=A0A2P2PLK2_RHIMU